MKNNNLFIQWKKKKSQNKLDNNILEDLIDADVGGVEMSMDMQG